MQNQQVASPCCRVYVVPTQMQFTQPAPQKLFQVQFVSSIYNLFFCLDLFIFYYFKTLDQTTSLRQIVSSRLILCKNKNPSRGTRSWLVRWICIPQNPSISACAKVSMFVGIDKQRCFKGESLRKAFIGEDITPTTSGIGAVSTPPVFVYFSWLPEQGRLCDVYKLFILTERCSV